MTLRSVLEESSARGLQVETLGAPEAGLVRNQDPPAGSVLPPASTYEFNLRNEDADRRRAF